MLRELLCIWTDWKSLNRWNFLEDIYIKFRETELVEISWLSRVWIHGSLRMQECRDELKSTGAIHSTKISGNFGPKLNGSVRSNRKSFEKTGPPFKVVLFSRSDRSEFWLNGFNFRIINSFMVSCGVRFTWLDSNNTIYVAGLFLLHRLWRNKLTRLLVSRIKNDRN